ncbi:hypothetical protein Rhopal_004704-T1 [Rhodotorula paludigena]|uniref:Mediator of RNA polymerase II transcription subunit 25 n=1 Tax=Rhodotorula paludigena TaxID=86838 RepID=A0AAV5GGH1_9BASI|nr:hypothetical protein Rhopal_004704-T1 [Rhodotorula paludigena]
MDPPKPAPTPRKRNTVPVILVVDPSPASQPLVAQYAQSVIAALQALHPQTQLLFSAIVPSSHATPLNPFLPPAAFLAALPSFTRQPARPASTLWRSTTGLLRAIRTARRRLVEGPLAGAGGEGKAQLPKYVVVISATDVENMGGDEVWLEDDDQGETWESFAKTFTRATTRFPVNLLYNSPSPPPNSSFTFPLLSPSHACFLTGFYNNNARPSAPTPQPNGTSQLPASNAKRAAPPEPATANKKAKPNPTALSSGPAVSPQLANANIKQQQQPTPPNPSRTPHQPPSAPLQHSPQLPGTKASPLLPSLPSNLTNESLQHYIAEMQAAAARSGQPPPTAADIQAAALAAYAKNNGGASAARPGQQPTPRQGNAQLPPPGQHPAGGMQGGLPQIPPEMRAKIESHLQAIGKKVERGELSQAEASSQVRRLQEIANQHRLQMAQKQAQAQAQAQGHAQGQGLGLNIPLAPGLQTPQSAPAQPLAPQPPQQQQKPPSQQQQQQQQQQQPRPQTIWRGPISWALSEVTGTHTEYTMFCQAAPLQNSAIRDLADVKLPQSWRVTSLVQIQRSQLQDLANKHTLPAVSLQPIPTQQLPEDLRKKQLAAPGGHSNESLYSMFAQSMEMRSTCGVARFSGSNNGLVLIPVPNQSKLLALIFLKIPLPDIWLQDTNKASASAPPQQANHARAPSQPQRPPSAQSGMFSSPVQPPYQIPQQQQSSPSLPMHAQLPTPAFTAALGGGGGGGVNAFATGSGSAPFNLQQPPPPMQQQQVPVQAPQSFPEGGIGGMDFGELQRILGADQLAQIMSGI